MSQLPPGIKRICSDRDLDGNPVVRVDIEAPLLTEKADSVAIVGNPRSMRALAALILKQADLSEGYAAGRSWGWPGARMHIVGGC